MSQGSLMYFNELISNYEKQHREKNVFHDLMAWKVREILLVATMYDSFIVESDGALTDQISGEYHQLNLSSSPRVTSAYTEENAVELFIRQTFDMVILMVGLDIKATLSIATRLKALKPDISILMLLNNNTSLPMLENEDNDFACIDRIFVWNSYTKLFVGMIKYVEDLQNAKPDTATGLVRVILIIEDSIRYYSRYLPVMHTVIMRQVQALVEEEQLVENKKILRMRARPKLLLATNYEEALALFNQYQPYLLAVISDVRFNKNGKINPTAGFDFMEMAQKRIKDLPFMIQSSELVNRELAYSLGASFSDKNSNSLDFELKAFLTENLGFGAFIFRDSYGTEIARAQNMEEFIERLRTVIPESILYHGTRHHFSAWLMARGEIAFARIMRQYLISDLESIEENRGFIIKIIDDLRRFNSRGEILNFDETALHDPTNIVRFAKGSLGGKGRGITFIRNLIDNFDFERHLPGFRVALPQTVVLGIDEFESFVERNSLWKYAYSDADHGTVREDFVAGKLSDEVSHRISRFASISRNPLAVRSSGLFEDMLMLPFAGIYDTYLIPNSHSELDERVKQIETAIKLTYASMFSKMAKCYFEAAGYKIEEERMGVIIQEVVGRAHGRWFYPDFSGTAQSYNWYPVSYIKPEDGFCVCAVGLGAYVVDAGECFRFCPLYPKLDILSPENQLNSSQNSFYAIDLEKSDIDLLQGEKICYSVLDLEEAEKDGTLKDLVSTYDFANNRLVPGTNIAGTRIVNFAPILKYDVHPFAEVVKAVLELGSKSMGTPVEIEYSVNLRDPSGKPTFYILQLKPLIRSVDSTEVSLDHCERENLVLFSEQSMGNGRDDSVMDLVFVKPRSFDRSKTETIATEIETMNDRLRKDGRKYILIGPGRWGTRDRWLGIPVNFGQISNSRVIVETALEDFQVDSSLGSHFFHNVTSMNIGYFTVPWKQEASLIDWEWLERQDATHESEFVKHIRFDLPFKILMDGTKGASLIVKPGLDISESPHYDDLIGE